MNALPPLPARDPNGHKGTFGTVCVIGGQCAGVRRMIGGPALTANAALRAGAGLAVLAMPAPIVDAGLTIAPGATGLALPVDSEGALLPSDTAAALDAHVTGRTCFAIGPGFGVGFPQTQITIRLLAQEDHPVVVDADALNALAHTTDWRQDLRAAAVLTPHPGEFRRLAGAFGIEDDPVDPARRPDAAAELARRLGCVVVLKGPQTIVSDGQRTESNTTGGPALATAGSGDVLTGVIASLIAQAGGRDLFGAARLGTHLHGRAADRWSSRHGDAGLLAQDLVHELPDTRAEYAGAD